MKKAVLVIDMPTTCVNCMFCSGEICWLKKRSAVEFDPETRVYTYITPEWCPLKPLPEKKKIPDKLGFIEGEMWGEEMGWNTCIDEIVGEEKVCTYKETGCGSCKLQTRCPNDAPTVKAIPIELYEQVIGERDVAVEQLKALNIELFEKPYRKAIPIDWLKKFANERALNDGMDGYWHFWGTDLLQMIDQWEKENE